MNLKTKQLTSIGLSIIGAGGTIATALLVREAAKKEVRDYQDLLPFKKGNIKDVLNIYKLPIAVGVATVTSIVASTILTRRAEASLMSMAVVADQGWRKYKNQVKETLGLDTHKDILKGIANKEQKVNSNLHLPHDDNTLELYYEENVGYFQANPEELAFAYAEINEMMNTSYGNGPNDVFEGITLGRFLGLANARLIKDVGDDILEGWGWTMDYLSEVHGNCWIKMGFELEVTDDGVIPYKVISWINEPIMLLDEDYHERLDLKFDELNLEYVDLEMFNVEKDERKK